MLRLSYIMSIENIRELFSKRISEAERTNFTNDSKPVDNEEEITESSSSDRCFFESLMEHEAGITEYLNKSDGFNAVVKARFSDFQVHEIDLEGNIVSLTNFDIPHVPEPTLDAPDDILKEEIWEKLKLLQDDKIASVEIDVSDYDKEKRRKIHKLIKGRYKKLFNTNTVSSDVNGKKKSIIVSLGKSNRSDWPSECGNYLHFVLFKTNIDTMDAINLIASKLSTKASNFSYAGTKDKRGKTSQRVSMWHLNPERLNSLNKCFKKIQVGNFSYKNIQLKLGDLKGNHFKIALRNITTDNETIDSALNSLKENGFINYFGLQRFGNSPEVPTFKIGKALIKGDFKNAVELILKPRAEKNNKDGLEEAKKIWWETKNAQLAYENLKSKNKTHEGKLLQGLAKHGANAYVNALEFIPRNVRLLYLHSYQSLLWNKIVSKRIKELGLSVLAGDLTYTKSDKNINEMNNSTSSSGEETVHKKAPIKCLKAEEIKDYKISDIIHPLPGYNVTYPDNIIKTWYEELLKEEGLNSEEFKQKIKEYSLSGTYRHIVKEVKDLSWNVVFYSRPEDDLILSDLDVIKNDLSNYCVKQEGEYKAVIINFSLDSSTYATMAIREVLKTNISSSYQASLNNYSNKRKLKSEGISELVRSKKVKM